MTNDLPVLLIVDDEPLNLQYLAEVLDADYRVKVAPSGPQALELARRAPYPEVILLDVMMPDMDGYAVCAALKADPFTAAIPVIFITAKTDAASETAALEAGAVDFIHKPINTEVVRARVRLQQELARYRHHLEELVDERTRELARARDAAEGASRAKTAFLRNASHEMRTPLHHITGMTYLLRETIPEGPAQPRLEIIDQAARALLRLVTDLLDFTRLEGGELALESQPLDLHALLARTREDQMAAVAAKGLTLVTAVDPSVPETLMGDSARLSQILAALLDNAIKFSERGEIRISVRAGERHGERLTLCFEVADQGIGLEPDLAERLFEPFQAGDDSATRQHAGLGLGLALCERLLKLMMGEIHLSGAPGQGVTARFQVPLRIAASLRPTVE